MSSNRLPGHTPPRAHAAQHRGEDMFLIRAPDPTANLNTSLSEMLSAITNTQQQTHQQANHTSEMRDMSNNIMYMQALQSSFNP